MKNQIFFMIIIFILLSCEKETIRNQSNSNQYVDLLFGGGSLKSSDSTMVKAEIISTDPFKLESDEIKEVDVTIFDSGIKTYGYVLIKQLKYWDMKKCYCLMVDGCFHYGTLMTDNYGDSLFFPSTNAIERAIHPDICPEDGSAFGK